MFGYKSPESLAQAREISCEERIVLLVEWKLKVLEVLNRLDDTIGEQDKYLLDQLTELRYAIADLQSSVGRSSAEITAPGNFA